MSDNNTLLDKLDTLVARFEEVSTLITDPAVIADQKRYVKLTKEYKRRPEALRQADQRIQGAGRPDEGPQGIRPGARRHRRGERHHRQRERPGDARHGPRGARPLRGTPPATGRGNQAAPHPRRPAGQPQRYPRNPRRHGRRRGGTLCRRPLPHVLQVLPTKARQADSRKSSAR